MTARTVRALVSITAVAAVATTAACAHYYEIPIETPIKAQLDVSAFQRVLVAGFISGGIEDVDANVETTRLLRSQLRTKSELRVIDADTLPLMEVAANDRAKSSGGTPAPLPPIKEEKDLEPYEPLFSNVAYWKQIGEEYQQPLIVTGTVMFTSQERSSQVLKPQETRDEFGRRQNDVQRVYVERREFVLRPKFIFIDGRTGERLTTKNFTENQFYNPNQQTPALSSYFELMDRLIPSFLATLSSQKMKGTRFLLQ
jgi:hypothetical protein